MSRLRARVTPGSLGGLRPGELLHLGGAEGRRLVRVVRARPGEVVELFDGQGGAARGRVRDVDGSGVLLAVEGPVGCPDPPLPIILAQAVLKGDRTELALEKATELGATGFWLVVAHRSVARPAEGTARLQRLRRVVEGAARQCGRARVPEIRGPMGWDEAAEDLAALGPGWLKLVAWEGARQSLVPLLLAGRDQPPVGIAGIIGPEGGLTEAEVARMEAAGARAVGLGPRILRAETAAATLVALVQALLGDLGDVPALVPPSEDRWRRLSVQRDEAAQGSCRVGSPDLGQGGWRRPVEAGVGGSDGHQQLAAHGEGVPRAGGDHGYVAG